MASEGKFDMLFVAQKNATEFPEWHVKPIWCPLGCDRDLHFIGNRAKEYDVCFIGNFHSMYQNTRLEYVDALFKKFPNFYYGNRAFYEMAEKFRSSKIVFNHAINNDINMRFFEACCSGSFQLAPYIDNNGLEELFQDGVHLVTYKSIKNALDLAEFYLNNEEAREKIAKAGMIHINNNHTYIHRTKAIMKEAERVLL